MVGISATPDLLAIKLNGAYPASKEYRSPCNDYFSARYRNEQWALLQFLILASDGLWDVVANNDAVSIVCDFFIGIIGDEGLLPTDAFQNAAQLLSQEAYVRGSTDNVGVCIVDLNTE